MYSLKTIKEREKKESWQLLIMECEKNEVSISFFLLQDDLKIQERAVSCKDHTAVITDALPSTMTRKLLVNFY